MCEWTIGVIHFIFHKLWQNYFKTLSRASWPLNTWGLSLQNEIERKGKKSYELTWLIALSFSRHLVSQLSAVERFALAHIEFMEKDWRVEQLDAAEAELAATKKELEKAQKEEEIEFEQARAELLDQESSSDDDDDDDDDTDEEGEDDTSDGEDDSDDVDSDENEEGGGFASPRTRSRGDVKIDLWTLDDKKWTVILAENLSSYGKSEIKKNPQK